MRLHFVRKEKIVFGVFFGQYDETNLNSVFLEEKKIELGVLFGRNEVACKRSLS